MSEVFILWRLYTMYCVYCTLCIYGVWVGIYGTRSIYMVGWMYTAQVGILIYKILLRKICDMRETPRTSWRYSLVIQTACLQTQTSFTPSFSHSNPNGSTRTRLCLSSVQFSSTPNHPNPSILLVPSTHSHIHHSTNPQSTPIKTTIL